MVPARPPLPPIVVNTKGPIVVPVYAIEPPEKPKPVASVLRRVARRFILRRDRGAPVPDEEVSE